MKEEALQCAALARPFSLGMLYNAHNDSLLPGVTLWDEATIQNMTIECNQQSSDFEISSSDSLSEKSSRMEVSASLKASFLFGLVKVGVSARYLTESRKSNRRGRASFQYKATTAFKQLMVSPSTAASAKRLDGNVRALATHVVTAILYGANASFIFDSVTVDASSVQQMEGSMAGLLKKVPSLNGDGVSLTDEEQALADKFTCKFYGDVLLRSSPATFEEAVKTYMELPQLLREKEEQCVPLTVWMMPLTELEMRASNEATPPMPTEIHPGFVLKAQHVLEEFEALQARSYDYLEGNTYFLVNNERLRSFQKLCIIYINALRETSAKKLPSIREGNEDQAELMRIYDHIEETPFSPDKLRKWMSDVEREVSIIESCVELMEGAKVVPGDMELAEEILDPEVEEVLCFVFTSLETTDSQLQDMSDYLDSLGLRCNGGVLPSAGEPWYFSEAAVAGVRERAKEFGAIARALKNNVRYKLLVAAITNRKHRGASIYRFRNAVLLSDNFSRPDFPSVEKITDKRDLIWCSTHLTLDPETAHQNLLLSEGNRRATQGQQQSRPELPQRFDPLVQVLCRQGLSGRHYWEVEWSVGSGDGVGVGVAYRGVVRKGDSKYSRLGQGKVSWCFGGRGDTSTALYAKHDGEQLLDENFPAEGFTRVGVYLDWPAGTLSFYKAAGDILSHVYTFKDEFTEPLYPAFLTSSDKDFVLLC